MCLVKCVRKHTERAGQGGNSDIHHCHSRQAGRHQGQREGEEGIKCVCIGIGTAASVVYTRAISHSHANPLVANANITHIHTLIHTTPVHKVLAGLLQHILEIRETAWHSRAAPLSLSPSTTGSSFRSANTHSSGEATLEDQLWCIHEM